MSSSHYQIYAASSEKVEVADVATEVGTITGLTFVAMPWPDEIAFGAQTPAFGVTVSDHDLVEAAGIPFPDFPFEIEVRSFTGDKADELRRARSIADALEGTGRYRTMITWDAQVVVDNA